MDRSKRVRELLRSTEDGKLATTLSSVNELGKLEWDVSTSVYFLRNFTLESIEPQLALAGFRRGMRIKPAFSDFDTYQQEILDPGSRLRSEAHDAVVLSLWLERLPMAFGADGALDVPAIRAHLHELVDGLRRATKAIIVLTTFLPPITHVAGWPGLADLAKLNEEVSRLDVGDGKVVVIDLERLAGRLGAERALD